MADKKNKKIKFNPQEFQTVFDNPYDKPEYEEQENFAGMRSMFELKKTAELNYSLGAYDYNMLQYTRKVEFLVLELMVQELRTKKNCTFEEIYLHFKKLRESLKKGGGIKQVEDKLGLRGLKERVRKMLEQERKLK